MKVDRAVEVFTHNSTFSHLMLMKLSGLKKCTVNLDDVKFDRANLKDNVAMRISTTYIVFHCDDLTKFY